MGCYLLENARELHRSWRQRWRQSNRFASNRSQLAKRKLLVEHADGSGLLVIEAKVTSDYNGDSICIVTGRRRCRGSVQKPALLTN